MSEFGKVSLEAYRLLDMKLPKITEFRIAFEPVARLGHAIERAFAEPLGLLQEGELSPLDPFVLSIMRFHV